MNRIHHSIITAATILAGAVSTTAQAGGLSLVRSTIDGGGGVMSAGQFVLHGTIGQHDASTSPPTGAGYGVTGGFWTPPALPDPCPADLAPPFGVLDLADIIAFITAFGAADPIADFAPPFGVFDLADIVAYVTAFQAGCP